MYFNLAIKIYALPLPIKELGQGSVVSKNMNNYVDLEMVLEVLFVFFVFHQHFLFTVYAILNWKKNTSPGEAYMLLQMSIVPSGDAGSRRGQRGSAPSLQLNNANSAHFGAISAMIRSLPIQTLGSRTWLPIFTNPESALGHCLQGFFYVQVFYDFLWTGTIYEPQIKQYAQYRSRP